MRPAALIILFASLVRAQDLTSISGLQNQIIQNMEKFHEQAIEIDDIKTRLGNIEAQQGRDITKLAELDTKMDGVAALIRVMVGIVASLFVAFVGQTVFDRIRRGKPTSSSPQRTYDDRSPL